MTSSRWSEPSANDKTKGETQMELSACIVVYNGAEEAIRAAQTVLDCTRRYPLTLYLVDNASPDGGGQRRDWQKVEQSRQQIRRPERAAADGGGL